MYSMWKATFDSTEKYCDCHWSKWWAEGTAPKAEIEKEIQYILKGVEKKYGKQK